MSRHWIAFLDPEVWSAAPAGNPFGSLASLYQDALRLWQRQESEGVTNRLRLQATRRAIDRLVREQCHEVSALPAIEKNLSSALRYWVDKWPPPEDIASCDGLDKEFALGIAGPEQSETWLRVVGVEHGVEGLSGHWIVAGNDTFAAAISAPLGNTAWVRDRTVPTTQALVFTNGTDEAAGDEGVEVLWSAMRRAAQSGKPVALAKAADASVIEALWRLTQHVESEGELLVRFADESVSRLPVHGSDSRRGTAGDDPFDGSEVLELVAGLMSMRHPELDRVCSFYWFRNERLSGCERLAEAVDVARSDALIVLESLAKVANRKPIRVQVHLTGFHPAIVGLVAALQSYEGDPLDLEVIPLCFRGDEGSVEANSWRIAQK